MCYLSNIAVLRSGELVRCGMVADSSKVPFNDSLGSMLIERAWDVVVSALLLIAMVFLTPFGDFMVEQIWQPFVASLNGRSVWTFLAVAALTALAVWLVLRYKEKIKSSKAGAWLANFLKGMANGVKSAFRMEHSWAFILYTVIIQVLYWLEVVFVIEAFPAVSHLGGMDALFIMMLGLIGWAIPVQSGFGAYHVIVSMALVPIYGIDQQTALVFATISHEAQIVQMIIVGLAALVLSFFLKRIRNRQKQNI